MITLDTDSMEDLQTLVSALYTGCLELNPKNVASMTKIYETLQLEQEVKFCKDFQLELAKSEHSEKEGTIGDLNQISERNSGVSTEGTSVETDDTIKVETAANLHASATPEFMVVKVNSDGTEIPIGDLQQTLVDQGAEVQSETTGVEIKEEPAEEGIEMIIGHAITECDNLASQADDGGSEQGQSDGESVLYCYMTTLSGKGPMNLADTY